VASFLDSITGGISKLLSDLWNRFVPKSVKTIIDKVRDSVTHISTIFQRLDKLFNTIRSEITAWRSFRENIRYKSRVINVPKAYEQTVDFINQLKDTANAVRDLITKFKEKLGTESPVEEAEKVSADLEEGGAESLVKQFPKLAKGLEKLAGILTLAVDALATISDAIDDVQQIVDEISRIREEIQTANSIFLPQSNRRKSLGLRDGGSIHIRVGSLHSSA